MLLPQKRICVLPSHLPEEQLFKLSDGFTSSFLLGSSLTQTIQQLRPAIKLDKSSLRNISS